MFVWTPGDALALVFLSLGALFCIGCFIADAVDRARCALRRKCDAGVRRFFK